MDGLDQLAEPQFHVVEVRNSLSKSVGNVSEHRLEMTEGLSRVFGIFRVDGLVGLGSGDEHGDPPELAVYLDIGLGTVLQGDESQYLPVDIGLPGGLQLATDVPCGSLDVVLEQFHILEHSIVDPLKDIIGGAVSGCHFIGVIDESVSQRGYFLDLALDGEASDDLFQVFHYFVF